ncbi:hypothetical protein E3N86_00085 [Cryobacterium sp. Hz7]|uniref:hypothetical protein n=1 Tax=Cryobacterium sp. Hz7 TaxID=1259166 RepID=UPI00106D7EE0|nr:hypothetical protein [Cryobacterium sp. Hz7]TFB67208.1 hypothetical protein E3N86_00085 [Cryobacterium sp. Hz7]
MTRSVRPATKVILVGLWDECAAWAARAELDLREWAHLEPVGVAPPVRIYELRADPEELAERLAAERRGRE